MIIIRFGYLAITIISAIVMGIMLQKRNGVGVLYMMIPMTLGTALSLLSW